MDWDDCCKQYLAAYTALWQGSEGAQQAFNTMVEQLVPAIRQKITALSSEEFDWLIQALGDEQRKWFVAFALKYLAQFPEALFAPMIRAGVYERNPSANRDFIDPCLTVFGYRRVNEALLSFLESGSNFEKSGAVNALYWAQFRGKWQPVEGDNEQAAYEALNDVWLRKRCIFLHEFVFNDNVDVRRSIIASLQLAPDLYPDDLKPLINQAIEIARTNPDEYVRHRVEVQLGHERLLKPLPHRD